ncbi:DUF2975 domain-containing protein [Tsuneonella amylolytica]|uniref:DUF2975 domain-containing protein n=1 Tax=Tsuneonella amylolytica TaxID=2338327 RepID=UPI000EAA357A|nr:DUF2975 domain-containing protein [Tsuneonella amylolytica]
MTLTPKDPLLLAARALILFFIAAFGLGVAGLAIGVPAFLLYRDPILAAMTEDNVTVVDANFIPTMALVMVLAAALLGIAIWFLVLLRRIVDTVGIGDPFISDNADRLRTMGWLALAGQVVAIPLGVVGFWLAGMVRDNDSVRLTGDFNISGAGVVLVLVLFILARVFRQGAAMRKDLEGTV